jgi:hypothetical protein
MRSGQVDVALAVHLLGSKQRLPIRGLDPRDSSKDSVSTVDPPQLGKYTVARLAWQSEVL